MNHNLIRMGTLNPDAVVVGCWSNLEHAIHLDLGVRFQCTVCDHVVEQVGRTAAAITIGVRTLTRECECEASAHTRMPPPQPETVYTAECILTAHHFDFTRATAGAYRISVNRRMVFILLNVFNEDQCCWRIMKKGRPVVIQWGSLDELDDFLSGKWQADLAAQEAFNGTLGT